MKILAMEIETGSAKPEQFAPHLKAEAKRVWELTQTGIIREIYFRSDRSEAVLILECANADEARETLGTFPLVKAELIRFDIIPLVPYSGFSRLFAN